MNKDFFLATGFLFWIVFIFAVGYYIVGMADFLAYGMIAWCIGSCLIVQGIKMAIRG